YPGAGGVRGRGIAGRVTRAHAAPVFTPAPRATLSTKIWALGRHISEARRGAARQSLRSVLYSLPAWRPEQSEPNASLAAVPSRRDIHPRFAQVRARTFAPVGGRIREAWNACLECTAAKRDAFSARKITNITLRLACWLLARSSSPPAAKRSTGRQSKVLKRSAGLPAAKRARLRDR